MLMELIYRNDYGASYKIENAPNPICTLQLIVDSVGIFMSEADLAHLLEIVRDSDRPCFCDECNGSKCSKIWCTSAMHDLCLKIDEGRLQQLEDLIVGTQFILHIDDTLSQYRIN
ncbi:MAG: hypothetical protein ED555_08405 [Allomuricauda sp.]|nr:MAG: hypothetical protein ED555_08405 [Allomuricauda sp.]